MLRLMRWPGRRVIKWVWLIIGCFVRIVVYLLVYLFIMEVVFMTGKKDRLWKWLPENEENFRLFKYFNWDGEDQEDSDEPWGWFK